MNKVEREGKDCVGIDVAIGGWLENVTHIDTQLCHSF